MPALSLVWAVHEKTKNHDHPGGFRGVLVGHFPKDFDLLKEKAKKPNEQKPQPQLLGYVYDPLFHNEDIVLTEIEGRNLEVYLNTPDQLQKWRSIKSATNPRKDGIKMSLMIDDQARHGDRPKYDQKQFAFLVGFGTWDHATMKAFSIKQGVKAVDADKLSINANSTASPMNMRPIWRDSFQVWSDWTDPDKVECNLITMYVITSEVGLTGVTQNRPHYKFNQTQPSPNVPFEFDPGVKAPPSGKPLRKTKMLGKEATNDDNTQPGDADDTEALGESADNVEKEMDAAPDGETDPNTTADISVTDESGQEWVF